MDSGERVSSSRNLSRYSLRTVSMRVRRKQQEPCYPGRNTKGRRPTKGCGGAATANGTGVTSMLLRTRRPRMKLCQQAQATCRNQIVVVVLVEQLTCDSVGEEKFAAACDSSSCEKNPPKSKVKVGGEKRGKKE